MLREYTDVSQIKGEPKRRWFTDDGFDLIVWLDQGGEIVGFQLCYDKFENERALTWLKASGYMHQRVDDGESNPELVQKATPILLADGHFDHKEIANVLRERSAEIEKTISKFVYDKIMQYERHVKEV